MRRGAAIVAVLAAAGCSDPGPTLAERTAIVARVPAVQLLEEYAANEVAAKQRYDGKRIEVSGSINDIGLDILSTPYVTLGGSDESLRHVQAMFRRDRDEALVAGFSKGQPLTLQCRVSGYLLNVIMDECSVR